MARYWLISAPTNSPTFGEHWRNSMTALDPAATRPRPRLPAWLHTRLPTTDGFAHTRALLDELKLHTVCQSAACPNHWECWTKGTATFMIGGDRCTRACGFCAVTTAKPLALEEDEPMRVAEATFRLRLRHVVIDRKSTRLNSSHLGTSYAVFCLKKKL